MTRPLLTFVAVLSCLAASAARADIPYWQFRSGGFSPFVRSIAVDPTNPDVVYVALTNVGTPWGGVDNEEALGVYRSTDGGATWTPYNLGLTNLRVTALVVDPANPNWLFAATAGGGVFKWTDAAGMWFQAIWGLDDLDVYALAAAPGAIYAGTNSGVFYAHGGPWTHATGFGGVPKVLSLAIDPSAPETTVYAGIDGGVMKSTDGGATWAKTGKMGTSHGPEVHSIAIDRTSPSTVLAAGYGFDSGIWRSTDGGATWTSASTGLVSEWGNDQHMTTLAQDPLDPLVFYGSGIWETFRSVDGGFTWGKFATGLSRENCPAFGVHADGTVYTGSVFGDFHRLRVRPSGVNHFRCFKATARGFVPQPITLADRFGTQTTIARKPVRYCTPTDPMGEGVVDPTSHLVCYQIGKAGFTEQHVPFLSQRIDGYRGYRVQKPDTVCVPATVGAPAAAPRDAYRCLDGPNWRSGDLDFTVSDAYGSQRIVKNKLERLCAPADLDGAGENRIEPEVDLRCDMIRGKSGFARTTVTATDRFGTITLNLIKPETHCFAALGNRN